ncbi:hypothetical protein DPMN_182118, partial [Dreissena polymorpha]
MRRRMMRRLIWPLHTVRVVGGRVTVHTGVRTATTPNVSAAPARVRLTIVAPPRSVHREPEVDALRSALPRVLPCCARATARTPWCSEMSAERRNKMVVLFMCLVHVRTFRLPVYSTNQEAARITISDVSWLNRQKREAGRFPDKARIRISFDSRLIDFDIQRTYPAGFAPRVFVKREGAIVQNPYQMLQAGIYQDVSHGGAFLLCHRSANRSIESPDESRDAFEIFGSFHADNDQFVVQPSPDNVKGHMVSKIANEKLFFDSTKPQDYTYKAGLLESAARQHLRFRRQTKKYEIELLSVVDYNSYLFWYNLTAGSSDRHTDTVANIMEYMTYMVSAIDVRYQSISGEPFTISVLNSGVFIADTPEASPWSVTKVTDGRLPSNEGLTAFTEWVKSQTGLPKHDHAMGFTGYDVIGMTSGSDSSGIAGLRVLCTKDSTSLVEDKFNFITMTTASHELGH